MSRKPRALNVHGTLTGITILGPMLQKVKDLLDRLPVDEAYTSEGLAIALGFSVHNLQSNLRRLGDEYRYKEGPGFGYGNKETVKLKKEGYYERQEEPADGS